MGYKIIFDAVIFIEFKPILFKPILFKIVGLTKAFGAPVFFAFRLEWFLKYPFKDVSRLGILFDVRSVVGTLPRLIAHKSMGYRGALPLARHQ